MSSFRDTREKQKMLRLSTSLLLNFCFGKYIENHASDRKSDRSWQEKLDKMNNFDLLKDFHRNHRSLVKSRIASQRFYCSFGQRLVFIKIWNRYGWVARAL